MNGGADIVCLHMVCGVFCLGAPAIAPVGLSNAYLLRSSHVFAATFASSSLPTFRVVPDSVRGTNGSFMVSAAREGGSSWCGW